MKRPAPSWWRMRLDEDPKRPHSLVKSEIDGVESLLRLEPRARVLDLGCGAGLRTIELARRGYRVLGVDPDERALAHARAAAKGQSLNVHFLKLDVRAMPYRAEFDAVVLLDGAFGQLPEDRDDLRCLEGVRRGLKPGGLVAIDSLNRERLLRHFEPNLWERGEEGKDAVVLDRISFDFERGRLDNHRTIVEADGRRTPSFVSVRLYALTELKAQLERAGLAYKQCLGGFDGAPYVMDSPRQLVLAERPREILKNARSAPEFPSAIRIKGRRRS